MKGVPIKFRGVRADNGEMIYGWYVPFERNPLEFSIRDRLQGFFVYHYYGHGIIDSDFKIHAVNPETISQLVGYDAAGEEVYEGDELTDKFGHELTARIVSIAENTNPRKFFRASWGCNFDFKLKKQGD